MTREYVYRGFERFWHWTQAFLVLFLTLTGFEVHGSLTFFGFEQAVAYHSTAAAAFLVLIAFAAFWHLTTGEWRQYLPTRANLREQVLYYMQGIFQNVPEPTRKSARNKLNPLQRLVYLGLKLLVIPVMVVTGLLYLYYRYPQSTGIEVLTIEGLEVIALLHTAGAFVLAAFVAAHLYLITTGATPVSNLKAMLTGWHEITDHGSPITEAGKE
jgi:thiosulfate reductase cytochrome b subunit